MKRRKQILSMLLCVTVIGAVGLGGLAAAAKESLTENEEYLLAETEMEDSSQGEEEIMISPAVFREDDIIWMQENEEDYIISGEDMGYPDSNLPAQEGTEYLISDDVEKMEEAAEAENGRECTVAERIMEAIESGSDKIMINEDIFMDFTIRIPSGRTVMFAAADGVTASLFRADGFAGDIFEVEEDAELILGQKNTENGVLILDDSENMDEKTYLIRGKGMVKAEDSVIIRGRISKETVQEEKAAVVIDPTYEIIGDDGAITDSGGVMELYDLTDAQIVFVDSEPMVYSGEEKKPRVQVIMGQMTLSRLDYNIAYSDNINAGTALVTVTGKGNYTGTKSASFSIIPAPVQYQIESQEVETGTELSKLTVPESAVGVKGENVDGTLKWSASEGGSALPGDMLLSGMKGDSITLYWSFLPEKEQTNYEAASGSVEITFREPEIKENTKTELNIKDMAGGWENAVLNTGGLSNQGSAKGATGGEDVRINKEGRNNSEESEKKDTEEISRTAAGEGNKEFAAGKINDNPATGDNSHQMLWGFIMAAALLVSTRSMILIIMGKDNLRKYKNLLRVKRG